MVSSALSWLGGAWLGGALGFLIGGLLGGLLDRSEARRRAQDERQRQERLIAQAAARKAESEAQRLRYETEEASSKARIEELLLQLDPHTAGVVRLIMEILE